MSYKIRQYTLQRAMELGVFVRPSRDPKKKIDVLDKSKNLIASIGQAGAMDYPSWIEKEGLSFANKRREAYHKRHAKNMSRVGTPGYYAGALLW